MKTSVWKMFYKILATYFDTHLKHISDIITILFTVPFIFVSTVNLFSSAFHVVNKKWITIENIFYIYINVFGFINFISIYKPL